MFAEPKTERSRRQITLPARTVAVLKRHRASQTERRLLVGPAWKDCDVVVDRGDGEPLAPNTLPTRSGASPPRRGLKESVPRSAACLRDDATSRWGSAHVVSESLGHRSSAFTMDVYAAVLPSQRAAAAAAIDKAFGN